MHHNSSYRNCSDALQYNFVNKPVLEQILYFSPNSPSDQGFHCFEHQLYMAYIVQINWKNTFPHGAYMLKCTHFTPQTSTWRTDLKPTEFRGKSTKEEKVQTNWDWFWSKLGIILNYTCYVVVLSSNCSMNTC